MNNNNYSNDGPVVFVNGTIKKTKDGGKYYLWSSAFDLDDVRERLGTSVVNITVTTPRNAKNEFQRTIVIKSSERKYMPNRNGRVNNSKANVDYSEIPI